MKRYISISESVELLGSEPVGNSHFADFTDRVFQKINRADQRLFATSYVQGILNTPGRKSINRMVEYLGMADSKHHSLRHFINDSPWEWGNVRAELIRWMVQHDITHSWVLAPAFIPKRGVKSAGVHKAFIPALGRTVNCQIGMGLFLATSDRAVPVDWRLVLPRQWVRDADLRRQARIPDDVRELPLWADMLHLVDSLSIRDTVPPAPLAAKVCTPADVRGLIAGLAQRRQDFVVCVPEQATFLTEPTEGTKGKVLRRSAWDTLRQAASREARPSAFGRNRGALSALVRLADDTDIPGTYRLFAECPRSADSSQPIWLTNMASRPLEDLLRLAATHDSALRTIDELQDRFGLLDFEGRTFPGWHRHTTLVSAAYCASDLPDRSPAVL